MILNDFSGESGGVDLNLLWHSLEEFPRRVAREYRQDAVLPTDGFPSVEHLCADRRALWRRSAGADPVLRRALSGDGLRAADLPGEPTRYRDLSVGSAFEALWHGLPRTGAALDARRCQR